jgi:hypothetical protein
MGRFKLLREISSPEIPQPQMDVNSQQLLRFTHTTMVSNMPLQYEPMRQNRFLIVFPENTNIPSHLVRSGCRPSCSVNNGIMRWDDMEITFYDPIAPSTQQIFVDMIRNNTIHNIMDVKINMLDPTGVVVSEWAINGFISSINFGELDYSSDLSCEVSITLTINHAILNY